MISKKLKNINLTAKTILLCSLLLSGLTPAFCEFDNTNILVEQAVNDIYQQRYKQAHSILKEAYEQSPRHPGVHFNLGRLFELTGNFAEAMKEYSIAASLDQSMVAAKRGVARCSVELKKAGITGSSASNQNTARPSNGSYAPVVSQQSAPMGMVPPSGNQYSLPASPTPAPVISQQNQVIYSEQTVPQQRYQPRNDVVKTSQVYSSTNNLALPTLPTQSQPTKSSITSKAKSKLDNGDTDGAIKALEDILETNPNNADAHYLMGKALSMKSDLFGSIKHLEETIKIDEKYYEAYYLLGRNYAKVNLLDDSIKNYQIYYGVKPQASVATEMARVYETMGNQVMANDFYNRANSMNPGNSNLQMQVNESSVSLANDLYLRGNHAFSINQFREAANLLNQAISTNSLPDGSRRDAMRKLEIARFRIREMDNQMAPIKQGFEQTRKNFAPTSLKYYQLADIDYKNNFTSAISVEWRGYVVDRFVHRGRDFALMIKELDRDELEHYSRTENDYKLNKHYNNQAVFLLMSPKGNMPSFIKPKTMITFNGKTEWQFYEILNGMGSTVSLPTFDLISAYPVR